MKTRRILLLLNCFLFSGCACLHNNYDFKKQREQAALTEKCAEADVLVTDLTQAFSKRIYVLPNGQVCPGEGK